MTENRDKLLGVRWSAKEKALIVDQAKEEGLTPSAFIRTHMLKYCKSQKKK